MLLRCELVPAIALLPATITLCLWAPVLPFLLVLWLRLGRAIKRVAGVACHTTLGHIGRAFDVAAAR